MKEFLSLCEKLVALTNNECGMEIALCDLSGQNPRTVVVERDDNGTYTLCLQSAE